MKAYKWRTINESYVYVDADTGSDVTGDGTQGNPYQTLGKAYRGSTTKPGTIVCRGRFCEDMADGNHVCMIRGDYMGAATFDGEDTFLIYGFGHENMVIENCAAPTYDIVVHTGSLSLAGVGRASYANNVGYAINAYGVAGSSAMVGKSPLYMGCIGGNSAVKYLTVWKPKADDAALLYFGGNGGAVIQHVTVYDVPIEKRRKRPSNDGKPKFAASVFAKCDFYGDEPLTFEECLFTRDCWIYDADGICFEVEGETSDERYASVIQEMDALEIDEASRPTFTNCIFSPLTSEEIFNDPEHGDFTLKVGSDAVRGVGRYYGSLPPALNIPILDNSEGVAETWDEASATGLVCVSGNAICIDESNTSKRGEVLSKVVKIAIDEMSITGVFARFASKFGTHSASLSEETMFGATYAAGDELAIGKYRVVGDVVYLDANYTDGSILTVYEEGTTFAEDSVTGGQLEAILEPNVVNVCYVRSTAVIYARIKAADGLERGGVYYNYGTENITYRGRTIAQGESFVAANDSDTFSSESGDADYQIGAMFDDTRVPAQEWIPAQLFGEYFVSKEKGIVMTDADGVPISSGNYLSYQTTANGGYSASVNKNALNDRFCQFKIVVNRL